MNNHGTWAEPGDLVRYIAPNGTPTSVLGVVMEVRFDERFTGGTRKSLKVANTDGTSPAWAIAAYFRIIARSESNEA